MLLTEDCKFSYRRFVCFMKRCSVQKILTTFAAPIEILTFKNRIANEAWRTVLMRPFQDIKIGKAFEL